MRALHPLRRAEATPPVEGTAGATLFLPGRKPAGDSGSRSGWTLSPDLRQQITRRLRLIAITYSLPFFVADAVRTLLLGQVGERAHFPVSWLAPVVSILTGLLVAAIVSSPRLSWQTKLHVGLVFEVVASYGIALAQYAFPPDLQQQPMVLYTLSPSWVAIWMLFFSICVPAAPWVTLFALLASASAPGVVIWIAIHRAGLGHFMPFSVFFVVHRLPYLVCGGMAYVGARVVYNLGADVSRARDLGSYRLIERLGSGGMGEVWRASH